MIPILFEKTETAFTSNGLGALADAIICTVTEERNGSYELEMTYPISGIHYADIQYSRIILAVPSDGADAEPFEIYKITRPISGTVTVYAQHLSYRLSYTATCPSGKLFTSANDALQSLKKYAASDCPFIFSTDVSKAGQFQNLKVQSIRSLLGGQTGSVLDIYGGEYKFSKWNVSLLQARGASTPIRLEYGKNITDLKQEENIASTYTAVIAMWTKQDGDGGTDITYGNLVKTSNADAFPYLRTYVYDVSSDYQDKPSKDTLTARAQSYITSNSCGVPKISIDVSFVALWQTEEYKDVAALEHIHLCDTISVDFPALGVSAYAKVVKTKYNTLAERYESIEVGDSKTSLAQTIVDGEQQVLTEANAKFEIASNAIIAEVKRASTAEGTLSSRITQNATEISTKVTQGQVESTIEQKADSIRLRAKNIEWSADNSSMTADGHLTCVNASISGKLACNKTGHGASSGTGLYADADGLSVGQVSGSYGNMPVFSVSMTNGASTPVRVTGMGFRHSDGSDFGYLYAWGTESSDGPAMSSGHLMEDGVGKGCCFNKDIGISGRFFANGISSSGPMACTGVMEIGGGGDTEINKRRGGNVYIGRLGDDQSVLNILSDQKVLCKTNLDMNDQYILNVKGYGDISDARLKEDVESIDESSSRDFVMALRPVRYKMKDDPRQRFGFIAQEVRAIDAKHADLVLENDDGILNLSYTDIIADLVKVVQDQEARIAALEGEINGKG